METQTQETTPTFWKGILDFLLHPCFVFFKRRQDDLKTRVLNYNIYIFNWTTI
jgi:hypothetical protein